MPGAAILKGAFWVAFLTLGAVVLMQRISRRWLGAKVTAFSCALPAGLFAFTFVQALQHCADNPAYVPPLNGEAGDGTMVHACDSPTGGIARVIGYFVSPALAVMCGLMGLRNWHLHKEGAA